MGAPRRALVRDVRHRASLLARMVIPLALISTFSVLAAAPAGASPRPATPPGQLSEGVVPTISSTNVTPLPLTGTSPIPGEDPDPDHLVQGPHPNADGMHPNAAEAENVRQHSTNWSGEIETGSTYSAVTADWIVPSVVPSTSAKPKLRPRTP